jgi:hypothetical protein
LIQAAANRFSSEVNLAEEPWVWIGSLTRYRAGPLNKFGDPKRASAGDVVEEYWARRAEEDRD